MVRPGRSRRRDSARRARRRSSRTRRSRSGYTEGIERGRERRSRECTCSGGRSTTGTSARQRWCDRAPAARPHGLDGRPALPGAAAHHRRRSSRAVEADDRGPASSSRRMVGALRPRRGCLPGTERVSGRLPSSLIAPAPAGPRPRSERLADDVIHPASTAHRTCSSTSCAAACRPRVGWRITLVLQCRPRTSAPVPSRLFRDASTPCGSALEVFLSVRDPQLGAGALIGEPSTTSEPCGGRTPGAVPRTSRSSD